MPVAPQSGRVRTINATNIRFIGPIDDDDLTEEYLRNDVIVLPSINRLEAFGLVLLEGMAAGCVPVASDLPGVRDIAGKTGHLFPPGDVVALRSTLLTLATDPSRVRELQLRSSIRAGSYTWTTAVDRYEELFGAVLGQQLHRSEGPKMSSVSDIAVQELSSSIE